MSAIVCRLSSGLRSTLGAGLIGSQRRSMGSIMDGRELAKGLRKEIKQEVAAFEQANGYKPHLAIVTVGERPPQEAQRRALFASGPGEASWFDKVKGAKEAGMDVTHVQLPGDSSFEALEAAITQLNRRPDVHGIMVEQPFPAHLAAWRQDAWAAIAPEKDVDGMHQVNAGRLSDFAAGFGGHGKEPTRHVFDGSNLPTTPMGVVKYLEACGIEVTPGAKCLVVGRSKLVGLPIALLFLAKNATVTIAHSKTPKAELQALCAQSDIVVGAVGVPRLIKAEWLKPGALAINVGTTFSPEEKAMVGDIDRRGIEQVTNLLTPSPYVDPATGKVAPSGIGPLTLPVLLRSVLEAAKKQAAARAAKADFKATHGCKADTPALSQADIDNALANGLAARGWTLATCEETKVPILRKEWVCTDFYEAVELINAMRTISERMNHHPTFHLTKYRHLVVELSSAATRSLTCYDLQQADLFDALPYKPHAP